MKLTIKQIIINAVITLVIAAVMFYIMLPPVTLHSKLFVTYLAIVLVIFAVLCYGRTLLQGKLPFEGGFKVGPAEIALIGAAAVVALTAGTMAVNLFAYRMALRAADSYVSNLNASEMASSGILRYLFLFNPAVSFYNVINGQAGSGDMRKWFEPLFGVFPDNAITAHWTACSLILQCMLAMVLIAAAVWAITPGKWNRHGKNKGNDNR